MLLIQFGLLFAPNMAILLICVVIEPEMGLITEHNLAQKKRIFFDTFKSPFTEHTTQKKVQRLQFLHELYFVSL
uniref:Secreted protein n=1 Tax=Lepeophtheirus salmonis TaxID=72036 RepID=A0A0K2T8G5_LEPSM